MDDEGTETEWTVHNMALSSKTGCGGIRYVYGQMPRLQRTDLRYYCHRGRARSLEGKVPRMREDSQIGMATTGHGDS